MNNKNRNIFLLFLATLLGCIVFYSGRFTAKFEENQCYSKVIKIISEDTISAISKNDAEEYVALIKKLNGIPNNGYESNCSDILKFVTEIRQEGSIGIQDKQ